MKSLSIFFLFAFFCISCTNDSSKPDGPQVDQVQTELTEKDVADIFKQAQGDIVDSTKVVKYESVAGKGSTEESNGVILKVLTNALPNGCTSLPTTIGELNSGGRLSILKFDHNMNADAKAFGFSGSIDKKELLFIQDFKSYKVVNCEGTDKKIGIGLRCFIHVKARKGKIGYSRLPLVAANVEMNNAEASFYLEWLGFGMDGNIIEAGLPTNGDYNVDNFGKLTIVFNNVLKLLNSKNSTISINPVVLPEVVDQPGKL